MDELWVVITAVVLGGISLIAAIVTALKGKWGFVLLGLLAAIFWYVGAIRLGKPGSYWYRKYYDEAKRAPVRRLTDCLHRAHAKRHPCSPTLSRSLDGTHAESCAPHPDRVSSSLPPRERGRGLRVGSRTGACASRSRTGAGRPSSRVATGRMLGTLVRGKVAIVDWRAASGRPSRSPAASAVAASGARSSARAATSPSRSTRAAWRATIDRRGIDASAVIEGALTLKGTGGTFKLDERASALAAAGPHLPPRVAERPPVALSPSD